MIICYLLLLAVPLPIDVHHRTGYAVCFSGQPKVCITIWPPLPKDEKGHPPGSAFSYDISDSVPVYYLGKRTTWQAVEDVSLGARATEVTLEVTRQGQIRSVEFTKKFSKK